METGFAPEPIDTSMHIAQELADQHSIADPYPSGDCRPSSPTQASSGYCRQEKDGEHCKDIFRGAIVGRRSLTE